MSVHVIRNRATSYDVAKLAGVSQSAVSRTFSPNGSVSAKTREKVIDAAAKLGFSPNSIAQSLSLGRSRMVGFVVTQYSQLKYPFALKSAADLLARTGENLLLQIVGVGDDTDQAVNRLLQARVDVVICMANLSAAAAHACQAEGVPVVMVNRRLEMTGVDHVRSNHRQIMATLAHQLKSSGVRRSLFIDGPVGSWVCTERREGYLSGCRECGLPEAHVYSGDFNYRQSYKVISDLGDQLRDVDAIICADDTMAVGAIDAVVYEHGLRVPDDIQIIGHDNTPVGQQRAYRLTTINQQMDTMLEKAIALGYARRDTPERVGEDIVIDSEIVPRQSSIFQ